MHAGAHPGRAWRYEYASKRRRQVAKPRQGPRNHSPCSCGLSSKLLLFCCGAGSRLTFCFFLSLLQHSASIDCLESSRKRTVAHLASFSLSLPPSPPSLSEQSKTRTQLQSCSGLLIRIAQVSSSGARCLVCALAARLLPLSLFRRPDQTRPDLLSYTSYISPYILKPVKPPTCP